MGVMGVMGVMGMKWRGWDLLERGPDPLRSAGVICICTIMRVLFQDSPALFKDHDEKFAWEVIRALCQVCIVCY